jgi:hypothetical protein
MYTAINYKMFLSGLIPRDLYIRRVWRGSFVFLRG